jgi:hypothetical protein
MSLEDAHRAAGYTGNRGNASTLRKNQSISNRIAALSAAQTERAIERAGVNKAWVMERLRRNVERAMTVEPVVDGDGRPTGEYRYQGNVANRALELLGKEIGMFIDRSERGRPGEFSNLSDEELERRIHDDLVKAGIPEDIADAFVRARPAD